MTATVNVLIIDDEEPVRRSLVRLFEREDYRCQGAASASGARRQLAANAFDLVLCDVNMPGESGLDLVRFISERYPEIAVVMVTGVDEPDIAGIAIEAGAYGYIVKPFTRNEILIGVTNALHRRRLESEARAHRNDLAQTVRERTEDLLRSYQTLEQADLRLRASVEEIVERLSLAAEARDPETSGHIERMSRYSELLAREMGLDNERCVEILLASRLHDVGKIGIPDRVLQKKGKFTPADFDIMKRHSQLGHDMFANTDAGLLQLAGTIALTHHERWDGGGYPRGLAGEDIPLEGRIAAVADVYDALSSRRTYKPAWPLGKVVETLREGKGTAFDPGLVDLFIARLDVVVAIGEQHAN